MKKVSALDVALAIFILIILLWQIVGFAEKVAMLSLFDRVPEKRTILTLGVASIVWTCLSLHHITKGEEIITWRFRIIIVSIMLFFVLLHSLYFNIATNNFASVYQIIFVCAFVRAAGLLFVSKKPLLFAVLILLPNIYFHGLINPVCIGLKPIIDHPLYKKISDIVLQEPDSKWITYNSSGVPLLANFAYATGANVFNGLKYIPNLEEMKELSAKISDIEVYNRFSYITLLPVKGSEISFYLSSTADHYMIAVDPGNDCWKKLRITYCLLPSSDEGIYFIKYKQ